MELNQSQKRDAGKFDPMMIEEDLARALEVENTVLEFGKAKYGTRGGWMAVDMERYKSAGARHRRERMKDGIKSRDQETGLLHIAHEIINLQFQLEMHLRSLSKTEYAAELIYNEPEPVYHDATPYLVTESLADGRACPLTKETCHACPDGETCRANYRGNKAPAWLQEQQFENVPDMKIECTVLTGPRKPDCPQPEYYSQITDKMILHGY